MKLLLAEDQPSITHILYQSFHKIYTIHIANTGRSALEKIASHTYNAIILDLGLPDIAGSEVCRLIRARGITTPIMIVSGHSQIETKVQLLNTGANDYLTKPFHLVELEARLRALIRSQRPQLQSSDLIVGDLILNSATRSISRGGQPIHLRRKEFAFLECLMLNAGNVVSKSVLEALVWDDQPMTMANTIHVQVNNLRRKVDRPFSKPLIHTIHGVGYKIHDDAPRVTVRKTDRK